VGDRAPGPHPSASPVGKPSPAPRAILFDAGNTLVYVDPRRLAEIFLAEGTLAEVERIRAAEREARTLLHDAVDEGHAGTEPELWRAYFLRLFRESGVPEEALEGVGRRLREAHAHRHLWTWVEEGTVEALEGLAAAGYRLAVISNADGRVEALLDEVGLRPHFEFVLDSEVVGVEKPDPAIFQAACRRLELEPSSCLYVGDLYPVDYLGARGAGLDAVLLDPVGYHRRRAPGVPALSELGDFLRSRED
jgi:putative hydrolase of the HAD superfamily